uniref:Transposase n=1 Tax=Acrobeloides nanus TaxID=290746 RepID=A0A914CZD9_9BILA
MTDEWRSYRRLQRLNRFRHRAVNHGLHFVDPTDPAVYTQTIENKNGQLKDMIRRRHGAHQADFERIGTQKSECYKLLFMMSTTTFI